VAQRYVSNFHLSKKNLQEILKANKISTYGIVFLSIFALIMSDDELEKLFTNFQDHPTNDQYKIFKYRIAEQADYFQSLLEEKKIFFERDDEPSDNYSHYFAIKKVDSRRVYKLNHLALGRYRKPFVKERWARWAILLVGAAIVATAIIAGILNG